MPSYSPQFFSSHSSGSYNSAKRIVPRIISLVRPRSVVDVGCGNGTWVKAFLESGLSDCLGIDGAYVRREELEIPEANFMSADLERPIALDRSFDLALSLEVAEHLRPGNAENFVATLVKLAPVIVFSAAVPGQGGTHHVNEQWPQYWNELFRKRGYIAADPIRAEIWDDESVEWWYAQNLFFFVRRDRLDRYPVLKGLAAEDVMALIHPKLFVKATMPVHKKILKVLRNMFVQHI